MPAPDRYTITRIATRTTIAMLNAKTQFRVFGGAAWAGGEPAGRSRFRGWTASVATDARTRPLVATA
ncbi:MAG: hypothetical protein QOC67_3354, partial [Pseudonocardiales bacterium]|nr:hypothetical protein [Pseudonocardiales bacterium]